MEVVLIIFLDVVLSYFTIGSLFRWVFIDLEDFINILTDTELSSTFGDRGMYAGQRKTRVGIFFWLSIGILILQYFLLSTIYEEILQWF